MSNQSFDDDPGRDWTPIQHFNAKRELAQPERLHHLWLIARRRLGGGATVQDAEDAVGKYWERRLDADIDKYDPAKAGHQSRRPPACGRLDTDIDKYDPAKGLRFWRFVCHQFGYFCQDEGKKARKTRWREVSLTVDDGEGGTIELECVDEHAGHDPAWVLQQKQFLALLNRCLAQLREEHRLVFVLHEIEEFSVSETAKKLAEVLGREASVPDGSVKGWLSRARNALAQCLQKEGWIA